ncbi:MAG: hypothetical protein CML13_12630 [Puniceicoccaceae bacterium]|nr:hypothetical protein [Puniceicoccaceae bacterium]|tara:strand:+ start:971 stop:1408 length:438 start_codon:yes stop_codon:yes gene_type:complete
MKEFLHYSIAKLTPWALGFGSFCLFAIHFGGIEFNESFCTGMFLFGLALATYILGAATNKFQAIRELSLVVVQLWSAIVAFASFRFLLGGIFGEHDLTSKGYAYSLSILIGAAVLFFGIYHLRKHLNKQFEPVGAGQPDNPPVKP